MYEQAVLRTEAKSLQKLKGFEEPTMNGLCAATEKNESPYPVSSVSSSPHAALSSARLFHMRIQARRPSAASFIRTQRDLPGQVERYGGGTRADKPKEAARPGVCPRVNLERRRSSLRFTDDARDLSPRKHSKQSRRFRCTAETDECYPMYASRLSIKPKRRPNDRRPSESP